MAQQSPTSADLWLLDNLADFQEHSQTLLASARRQVLILSDELDAPVFAQPGFVARLSELARTQRQAQIHILLRNTRPAKETGHPLIRLQQRLSSKIKIRRVLIEPEHNEREFICCDTQGLLYKNDVADYRGFANYAAFREVKQLREQFTYLWEHAEEDPNLQVFVL